MLDALPQHVNLMNASCYGLTRTLLKGLFVHFELHFLLHDLNAGLLITITKKNSLSASAMIYCPLITCRRLFEVTFEIALTCGHDIFRSAYWTMFVQAHFCDLRMIKR